MLTVSRRHNYYSFMPRSTCIFLHPATDERQTGDNFVAVLADTRNMFTATSGYNLKLYPLVSTCRRDPAQHVSWCKRGITAYSKLSNDRTKTRCSAPITVTTSGPLDNFKFAYIRWEWISLPFDFQRSWLFE